MSAHLKIIAVLGGNGFLGWHTTRALLERGYEVHVYSRHACEMDERHPRLTCFNLDIRLANQLPGADEYNAVINATGRVAGVGYNASHHSEMLVENFELMRHAADLAANQARYFVQISSACVYANEVSAGAREEQGFLGEPDAANYGYGWGKRMGEIYTRTRFTEVDKPALVLRPYNLYGPRDDFSEHAHVIPSLIRKFLFHDEIQVWGDGSQVREFVYVEDLAQSIALAVERRLTGTLNVCGGKANAITIRELVELIERIMQTGKPIRFKAKGPVGQLQKFGNPELARQYELPVSMSLFEGLQRTIHWYLQHIKEDKEFVWQNDTMQVESNH
ncbi:MAG: NAD(P)-dependent oxidoreductase [candidate division KSB1 bacterium]|nr:NAD(P)-dependent oxidoreductase [candidate division KSB1 bacterium]MDQ7062673.1 NAD(P)-dependent oxidoreductase [candidate division KSB1 bacterium]